MSAPPNTLGDPIESKRQLVAYLAAGCKPPEQWRIGTEHEKFLFRLSDHRPVAFEGDHGIGALLERFRQFGWELAYEGDLPLAALRGGASLTLEPAGQFELSGATLTTVHETRDELFSHLTEMRELAPEFDFGMLGMGFEPKWPLADMPQMPKARSAIMRRYMPKVGTLGLDMMHRTCTVQVNLDFASEADMVRKFRVGMALQPIATALFAASPFANGKPNGFLSYRSQIWTDTDNQRAGILDFVFDPDFGFERYVDYVLDVPMYFVYRDGKFIDAAGQSFHDFMRGELPALPGQIAHMGDWSDHLTTVFPEVRLKRFLEMRGADCGSAARICGLPAFWVGLLYDEQALDQASALIADWSVEEIKTLRNDVPMKALSARFRDITARDLAVEVLAISRQGLQRRARLNENGDDESRYLAPLIAIAQSGRTIAEELLERFQTAWEGNIDRIYQEEAL